MLKLAVVFKELTIPIQKEKHLWFVCFFKFVNKSIQIANKFKGVQKYWQMPVIVTACHIIK